MMGAREGGVRPRLFLAVPLVCVGTYVSSVIMAG